MDYNLEKVRLSQRTNQELIELNNSLIESILSGSGKGFWNGDMGHPAYRMGAQHGAEEAVENPVWGDGLETNGLYQLVRSLHEEMLKRNPKVDNPIKSWQEFCSLAIKVYEENNPFKQN